MNGPPSGPGIVTFSYSAWIAQYPEFSAVTSVMAQNYFNRIAASFIDNTPSSPIQDIWQRTILLNLAVAHFAFLFAPLNGQAPRGMNVVGRLSRASEGSVSADFEMVTPKTATESFWSQSEYGLAYWVGSLSYRTAFYVPAPAYGGGLPGMSFVPGRPIAGWRGRW